MFRRACCKMRPVRNLFPPYLPVNLHMPRSLSTTDSMQTNSHENTQQHTTFTNLVYHGDELGVGRKLLLGALESNQRHSHRAPVEVTPCGDDGARAIHGQGVNNDMKGNPSRRAMGNQLRPSYQGRSVGMIRRAGRGNTEKKLGNWMGTLGN